ncbi:MAG: lipopolysaccharide biosynthesis protein [Rikenellaceae bacterium]
MGKREFISGLFFTAVAKYSSIIISLVVAAVLARLLTPEDFGVIAIATVILSFFAIISDLGIATAIVQNKDLTRVDLDNIFSFSIYFGVVISLLFYLSSSLISGFYGEESLVMICRLLSVSLLFSSLNIVPNALLLKAKRFKFIAIRTFSAQLTLGTIAIVAALNGLGVYSLLITPIGTSIFIFVVNYLQNPLTFNFRVCRGSIMKISSYSAYQFMSSLVNYFTRNLDNLLIGRYIGVADLGFYDKSYRLMMLPLANIAHVITPVLHPTLSDFQHNREFIFNSTLKLLTLLAYIGAALSVFLHFQAENLIVLIFGEQWTPSIPVFQILAISVAPQMLNSILGSIFQSVNDTRRLFIMGNVNTAINVVAIVAAITLFGDIEHVAIFLAVAFYLNTLFSYTYLFRTIFSKSEMLLAKRLGTPILLAAALIPISHYGVSFFTNPLLSILATAVATLVISLLFMQLSGDIDITGEVKSLITKDRR